MMVFPIAILVIIDENDREFMKRLYIKYHLAMFRMARALTDSDHDAENAVSDACVSLIRRISVLRQLDCNVLEGYIISTVKNASYALHRIRNAWREVDNGSELLKGVADENAAPDGRILQQSSIDELMNAIDQLSESDQAIIRMKYFQHLSDREIAKALEVQEVTVRSKLTRARQRTYRILREQNNDCGK